MTEPPAAGRTDAPASEPGRPPRGRRAPVTRGADAAYPLLSAAVASILRQSPEARRAYEAMRARGLGEEEAREEIARVLLGVMYHVGGETERLAAAGGGAGLRRECFRRLAEGETAAEIFGD